MSSTVEPTAEPTAGPATGSATEPAPAATSEPVPDSAPAGEPDLDPDTLTARSHAENKPGTDLLDMVAEDLVAERIAIDSYRAMINYIGDRDTTTKRILEGILAQEEEHADEFADLLNGWIG